MYFYVFIAECRDVNGGDAVVVIFWVWQGRLAWRTNNRVSLIMANNEQRDYETLHKDIRVAMPAISLDHGYLQE